MRKLQAVYAISCLLLSILAVSAFGQSAVNLQHKFTVGESVCYKIVVNMQVTMGGQGSVAIPAQIVGIVKHETKRLLDNGNAEISATIQSMKMDVAGNAQVMPTAQAVPVTIVLSPDGDMKSIHGLDKASGVFGGMQQFLLLSSLGQYSPLPANLTTGTTWTQNLSSPTDSATVAVQCKLLNPSTTVGANTVASIQQNLTGDLHFTMPMPNLGTAPQSSTIGLKGPFKTEGMLSLSTDKGAVVRSTGKGSAQLAVTIPNSTDNTNVNAQITYDIFVVPAAKTN
jgi:hypothetical protein